MEGGVDKEGGGGDGGEPLNAFLQPPIIYNKHIHISQNNSSNFNIAFPLSESMYVLVCVCTFIMIIILRPTHCSENRVVRWLLVSAWRRVPSNFQPHKK